MYKKNHFIFLFMFLISAQNIITSSEKRRFTRPSFNNADSNDDEEQSSAVKSASTIKSISRIEQRICATPFMYINPPKLPCCICFELLERADTIIINNCGYHMGHVECYNEITDDKPGKNVCPFYTNKLFCIKIKPFACVNEFYEAFLASQVSKKQQTSWQTLYERIWATNPTIQQQCVEFCKKNSINIKQIAAFAANTPNNTNNSINKK